MIRRLINTILKLCLKAQYHADLAVSVLEKSLLLSIQDKRGDVVILLGRIPAYLTQILLFPKGM